MFAGGLQEKCLVEWYSRIIQLGKFKQSMLYMSQLTTTRLPRWLNGRGGGGRKKTLQDANLSPEGVLQCATRSGNDNSAWVDIDGVHVPLLLPFQFRHQCPEFFSVAVQLHWSVLTRLLPQNGELSTHYWIESVREQHMYIFCIFP